MLEWRPGDVIVAKLGVACPMAQDVMEKEIESALGHCVIMTLWVGGSDIELSVIAVEGEDDDA